MRNDMKLNEDFIASVENDVGLSADEIRAMPLEDLRSYFEKRNGTKTRFVSEFPLIGRSGVLSDCLVTHDEVESMLDDALAVLRR